MKLIQTPFDPKSPKITDEERKQLWFLLVDTYNEEMPCVVCGKTTEDNRAVFAPEEKYRYVYGLDLFDMKSIIYAICNKCKSFVNELQIREKLKQITRGDGTDA